MPLSLRHPRVPGRLFGGDGEMGLLMLLILAEINKPAGGGGGEGEGAALPPLHEAVARGIRTRPRHEPAGGGAQVQPLPRQGAIKTQLGGGGEEAGGMVKGAGCLRYDGIRRGVAPGEWSPRGGGGCRWREEAGRRGSVLSGLRCAEVRGGLRSRCRPGELYEGGLSPPVARAGVAGRLSPPRSSAGPAPRPVPSALSLTLSPVPPPLCCRWLSTEIASFKPHTRLTQPW